MASLIAPRGEPPREIGGAPRARPLPHDLLRLARIPRWPDAPAWVAEVLARLPVVVVRRAGAPKGAVAIGVRGAQRNQRYGALLGLCEIAECVQPEQLSALFEVGAAAPFSAQHEPLPAVSLEQAQLPVWHALRAIAPVLRPWRMAWGPTGSVGFELATGIAVVHAGSDLDLLIRAPAWIAREQARSLLGSLSQQAASAGVRIDVQLETPAGAIALAEYAGQSSRVLLRHGGAPVLVEDPWAWGTAIPAAPDQSNAA